MQKPTYWEQREIERLSKKEADEPEFVTKRKKEMIALIKQGKGDEIVYDEWGRYIISSPRTRMTKGLLPSGRREEARCVNSSEP